MKDSVALILVIVFFAGICMAVDTAVGMYVNGIPQTHKGQVIYIAHKYNKWCGYEYTDIEVLTYSGDSHHIMFWDHVSFELGKTYAIYTVRESQLFFNAGWLTYERITELVELE